MSTLQPNQSEIRNAALRMTDRVFSIGMNYVKHQTFARFFVGLFKPRMDKIIMFEATEQELLKVMFDIENEIQFVLKKINIVNEVKDAAKYNSPQMQKTVENLVLKNNAFVPNFPKPKPINEKKAAEILEKLIG